MTVHLTCPCSVKAAEHIARILKVYLIAHDAIDNDALTGLVNEHRLSRNDIGLKEVRIVQLQTDIMAPVLKGYLKRLSRHLRKSPVIICAWKRIIHMLFRKDMRFLQYKIGSPAAIRISDIYIWFPDITLAV